MSPPPQENPLTTLSLFDWATSDWKKKKAIVELQDWILRDAKDKGLMKANGSVYGPIEGKYTAYKARSEYKDYIDGLFQDSMLYRENVTNPKTLNSFLEDFNNLKDFPCWKADPYLMCFNNGVLNISTLVFTSHDAIAADAKHPLRKKASRVFIELDYPAHEEPCTPLLDKVLNYQFEEEDVIRCLLGMLGRCFFRVGDKDNWQRFPYLHGEQGTGKSSVINLLEKCFDKDRVAPIAQEKDGRFGIAYYCKKDILIGKDMQEDLEKALPACYMRTMASGENSLINRKNEGQQAQPEWTAPMIFGSNHPPKWAGHVGAMSRRIVPFYFPKTVQPQDPSLGTRIMQERAHFVKRSLTAYASLVARVGPNGDFGDFLPETIQNWIDEVRGELDDLHKFLFMQTDERIIRMPASLGEGGGNYALSIERIETLNDNSPTFTLWNVFKEWFASWMGTSNVKINENTLKLAGFNKEVMNVCKTCSRRGTTTKHCCPAFSNSNRTCLTVIRNMQLSWTPK